MRPFFPLCCCRQYSIVWYAYHTIQYHIWYCIVWCGMVWYGRFFPPFAADWLTDKLSPSANARLFILTGTISAVMTINSQLTTMTNKWPWSSSSVGDICGSVLTSRSATPCFHLKIPGKVASPSSSRKAFKWASNLYNRGERVPVGEDFSEQCGSWRSGFIIVPVQVITLSDKAWLDLLHQPVNRFLSLWLSIDNFRFGSRTAEVL